MAEFEMIDLPAPAMFNELARGLGRPHLLELPPRSINERHDLRMVDTDELSVLDAIIALDSSFAYDRRPGVLILHPVGQEKEASPFSTVVSSFQVEGSVAQALQDLIVVGLPKETALTAAPAGQSRPVRVDMQNATVRDVLAEIAAQAHLSLSVEPGIIRMEIVPPVD